MFLSFKIDVLYFNLLDFKCIVEESNKEFNLLIKKSFFFNLFFKKLFFIDERLSLHLLLDLLLLGTAIIIFN